MDKWAKIIAWVLIVLVLIGAIGAIAYFFGGFTSSFQSFYVEIDGKEISSNASGYEMSPDKPLTVNVKYPQSEEPLEYSVKVVPHVLKSKDFDFKLDTDVYSYQAEKDLTSGFDIEYDESSFTIKPKGGITKILQAIYPHNYVSDCHQFAYENMYTLVVTSYDGQSSVTIHFSIPEDIWGFEFDKSHIIL